MMRSFAPGPHPASLTMKPRRSLIALLMAGILCCPSFEVHASAADTEPLKGLIAPVRVSFDSYGIPHIYGGTVGGGGASWRMIIDLADPQHSRGVYPGGQSGSPESPHYDDQIAVGRRPLSAAQRGFQS
jgi:acyl-homoserine lactone acylase PvdQ